MSSSTTLTFADGVVTLGGADLPGILRDLSVGCEVRFDEAEQDFRSGSTRTPMGWEDGDVALTLELLTNDESTCYRKLKSLNAVFKAYDSSGNPKVYDVASAHLTARGVRQVVFSGLSSSETDLDDVILCRLAFREYRPAIVEVESRASAAPGVTTKTDPELTGSIADNEDPA